MTPSPSLTEEQRTADAKRLVADFAIGDLITAADHGMDVAQRCARYRASGVHDLDTRLAGRAYDLFEQARSQLMALAEQNAPALAEELRTEAEEAA